MAGCESAYALNAIVSRIATQLAYIDGTGDYNLSVSSTCIKSYYVSIDAAKNFPHLCIAGAELAESVQEDQQTDEERIQVEVVGYVKKLDDPLVEVLKLMMDVERAIKTDESLGGYVYGLTFSYSVSSLEDIGVGVAKIGAKGFFLKP